MIACDINVLIYAHDEASARHPEYQAWLRRSAGGTEPFGLPSIVASGFMRIVTHPKILSRPLTSDAAIDFMDALRAAPAVVPLEPGRRHWTLFTGLCRSVGARGNAVPDAYLAALALENGATWYTADRGFARYPGLRVRHPLDRD